MEKVQDSFVRRWPPTRVIVQASMSVAPLRTSRTECPEIFIRKCLFAVSDETLIADMCLPKAVMRLAFQVHELEGTHASGCNLEMSRHLGLTTNATVLYMGSCTTNDLNHGGNSTLHELAD